MKYNRYCQLTVLLLLILSMPQPGLRADETCMSPYMAKIVGQEDFVYVWTLGTPGVGDEQDKLVVIAVNPKSSDYGTVVHSVSQISNSMEMFVGKEARISLIDSAITVFSTRGLRPDSSLQLKRKSCWIISRARRLAVSMRSRF